jgi:hypothetical protein
MTENSKGNTEQTKKCSKCGEVKSLTDYYLTSKKRGRKPRSDCKECALKQCSEYKQNNREKVLNYFSTRYQEDEEYREKKKRNAKIYRLKNLEIVKERGKLYRAKNKEKIAERKKVYAQKHKERDRPKYLAHTRARQLKLKNAIPIFLQDCSKEKNDVEKIYRLRQIFDKATGIKHHVDHMWPLSDGGPHWSGNLQVIPAVDNLSKHAKVNEQIKKTIQEGLEYARRESKRG